MRIGLIADIHANLFALRAALAALDRLGVERIACLGDVASPRPWPAETIDLLIARGIDAVRGNTDDWLLAADPARVSDTAPMNAINAWAAGWLGPAAMAWLSDLPLVQNVTLDGTALTLFHGSPRDPEEVIAATTPKRSLGEMLDGVAPGLAVGGHTHIPLLRTSGAFTIINPGSVGLGGTGPGTPDLPPSRPAVAAELAVLEVVAGAFSASFLRLPLDVPAMLDAAATTGMPGLEYWSSLWRPAP